MLCALRPVLGPGHLVATRLPLIRGPWLCVPPSRAVCPLDTLAGATARDRCRRRLTPSLTEGRESGRLSDRAGAQEPAQRRKSTARAILTLRPRLSTAVPRTSRRVLRARAR